MIDMSMPNVAFFGGMGAGKTTAARILQDLGYDRVSFAGLHPGGVRDVVHQIWPNEPERLNDRETLVGIAEKAIELDHDVWMNNLLTHIDKRQANYDRIREGWSGVGSPADACAVANGAKLKPLVNDDCRRPTEYDALRGRGFVMVRINAVELSGAMDEDKAAFIIRDREVRRRRLIESGKYQNDEQFDHYLELALDDEPGDYQIANDGTVRELEDEIIRILIRERKR